MASQQIPAPYHSSSSRQAASARLRPLTISLSALRNGMRWLGGPGTGKSCGIALTVVWPHLLHRLPALVIDPTGSLDATVINKVLCCPEEIQRYLWPRLKYVDMAATDSVVPMPLYRQRAGDTLFAVADRFPAVLKRLDPALSDAPILGWNSLYECAIHAGQIAAALGRLPGRTGAPARVCWDDRRAGICIGGSGRGDDPKVKLPLGLGPQNRRAN